jgi:DNA-binding HxlR family transcriptional regulator
MSEPRRGTSKALWLYMLENGGRWTIGELRKTIVPHDYSPHHLDKLLRTMADTGTVTRAPCTARKNGVAYGVTRDCGIPQGVTLQEVMKVTR